MRIELIKIQSGIYEYRVDNLLAHHSDIHLAKQQMVWVVTIKGSNIVFNPRNGLFRYYSTDWLEGNLTCTGKRITIEEFNEANARHFNNLNIVTHLTKL